MTELVKIEDLFVNYGQCNALSRVNLDIYNDDFIGVIGPNGGGKTTLVKAILGIIAYTGKIYYNNSLTEGGRKLVGYLPQQSGFDKSFPISVREVVMSGMQSEKSMKPYKNYKERADELLEMTGIADISHKPIGEISGGQMQRTLLCRALISDPRLLILDEPANFVDNKFERELYDILGGLNEKMAIIMVSHDIGTITSVVKSIVCVNRHVHRHDSNIITAEQLRNYDCPIQIITHGEVPHAVLKYH